MYIIFAPHIDDETIGCFTYLNNNLIKSIYYFFDITDERKKEAYTLRDKLNSNYNIYFIDTTEVIILDKDDIILAPNINDSHPHHKLVNLYAKKNFNNKKLFYSIDMNVRKNILSNDLRMKKRELLLSTFSSQKILLNSDEKYFLFESILKTDIEEKYEITYNINECESFIISSNCEETIHRISEHLSNKETVSDRSYLNYIIYNVCTDNCEYVEYTYDNLHIKKTIKIKF